MAHASTFPANTALGLERPQQIWQLLTATDRDGVQTALRLALAAVIFPHGAQKVLGWFGGYGFEATLQYFTSGMGLPAGLGLLVIAIEFLAPLALAVGVLSRVAALGISAVMIGAVVTSHWQNGFFMNWSGQAAGEGFEYHILALAIAVAVIVGGSGALSLDRVFARGSSAR